MSGKNKFEITTLIGRETELKGDFTASGSVRIDGIVTGNVTVTGKLILGAGSSVTGNLDCASCIIGGTVLGDVTSPEKTELTGTAKVVGNITTNAIVIDENAVFQGRCEMSEVKDNSKTKRLTAKAIKESRKTARQQIVAALKNVTDAVDINDTEEAAEEQKTLDVM
ncbi:MAG: polymer-forming cytoskeletal protein [Lachnospiraceae bacterium]|nr:polymer-forming cytoskeletal protein [Lachnospiraceae bacterium]